MAKVVSFESMREAEDRYQEMSALYDDADDLDEFDREQQKRLIEQARISYLAQVYGAVPLRAAD